jgi:hypothetical protein
MLFENRLNPTQIMKHKIACLLLLALAAHSYGTVTPISSSINLHAESNAGLGLVQDDQVVTQAITLNGLSTSVFAQASNGTQTATAESSASAVWTSADAGQFTTYTKLASDGLIPFYDARVATGGLDWVYTFKSDLPATLTLSYTVTHNLPYPYGMAVYFGQLIDHGSIQTIQGPKLGVPSSGSLSFSINLGQIYSFTLYDGSNLNQYLPAFSSEMTGTFSFQITPVPEPDSLILVCASGVALFTRFLRRRLSYREAWLFVRIC